MENFQALVENRHDYARDWKARTGRKVIGYFCTYVPEEIIYASSALPVRLMGSHEPQDITERYISSMYCPFVRDVLAQGLLGRYDYLDGVVIATCCVHMRVAYSSWELHVPTPYKYFLTMPQKVQAPEAGPFLTGEMALFKSSLEEWGGAPISDGALDRAIEVYNRSRRLMIQLYDLRRAPRPPVSGSQAMEMVLSGMLTDKEEHNRMLEQALGELPREGSQDGVRLMLIGSENDDVDMVRLVESLGGSVVVDDHCTGSRYFWNEVSPRDDRLGAIAARYVDKPPCPVKDWEGRKRLDYIAGLARDYSVEGALVIQQKFCDPHEFDIPVIISHLKEMANIPSLFLEVDITLPAGQFRTRIEAFLETIRV
jgi:benzoyl-CoA reductase subunit C